MSRRQTKTQAMLQSRDFMLCGIDRLVVSVIEDADRSELTRLSGLISLWQFETDRKLAEARQQAGILAS